MDFLYIQIAYKGHVKDSDTMLLIFNNYLKRIVQCKKKEKKKKYSRGY